MPETPSPQPAVRPVMPHGKSLALIVSISVACSAAAFGVGWVQGGQGPAVSALVGMASSAAGGLMAWAVLALMVGPGTPVTAVPTLGLLIRLVVTGAGVGLAVIGLGFEKRPVLLAALFGYLVLMAAETILLYRFASSTGQNGRSTETNNAEQAAEQDR